MIRYFEVPGASADQIRLGDHTKTAKSLGIDIPQTLLVRADDVVE
jgi:hypothetical protein